MNELLNFHGGATRSQYWAVQLVLLLVGFAVGIFLISLAGLGDVGAIISLFVLLSFLIVSVWFTLATTARRCRTIGVNPWWAAALLIPYIGWIPLIVLGCLPPKEENTEIFE